MDADFIWLAGFVLIAYTTQAMTGFGSVIIAVTLGSHLYPIERLLPVLVPLDVMLNSYIVSRYRREVDRTILFRKIVPLMGLGLLAGVVAFQFVQGTLLKRSFGLLVTILCVRELIRYARGTEGAAALSRGAYTAWILAAGVIQGLFASGGPPVVYAVSGFRLPKTRFRSTLASLWLLTNSVLTTSYVATGRFTLDSLKLVAWLFPLVVLGLIVGERLHGLVDERRFRILVYLLLLVAGLSTVVR